MKKKQQRRQTRTTILSLLSPPTDYPCTPIDGSCQFIFFFFKKKKSVPPTCCTSYFYIFVRSLSRMIPPLPRCNTMVTPPPPPLIVVVVVVRYVTPFRVAQLHPTCTLTTAAIVYVCVCVIAADVRHEFLKHHTKRISQCTITGGGGAAAAEAVVHEKKLVTRSVIQNHCCAFVTQPAAKHIHKSP